MLNRNISYKLRKRKQLISVGVALTGALMLSPVSNNAMAQNITIEEVQELGLPSEIEEEIKILIEAGENVTAEMIESLLAEVEDVPSATKEKQSATVISEPYIKINGDKNESKEVQHLDRLKNLDNATISFDIKPESTVGRFTLYTVTGEKAHDFLTIYVREGMVKVEGRDQTGNFYNLENSTATLEEGKWNNIVFSHDKVGRNVLYVNGKEAYSGITQRGGKFVADMPSVNTVRFGAMLLNGNLVQGGANYEIKDFQVLNTAIDSEKVKELSKFSTPDIGRPDNEYIAKSSVFGNSVQEGFYGYRAPYTLKTEKGSFLTASSKHIKHHIDWGDLNLAISRSEDEGKTWTVPEEVVDLAENPKGVGLPSSAFTIDSAMVQAGDGKIILLTDVFRESQGLFDTFKDKRPQYTNNYLNLYIDDVSTDAYTVRENGVVYSPSGEKTEYSVITPELSQDPKKSDIGNIIKDNKVVGNYLFTKDTPFRAVNRVYTWQMESTDDGKTWSNPKDVTKDLLKDKGVSDLLISPTAGIKLKTGRLIVPVYYNHESYRTGKFTASTLYSDDNGGTWNLSKAKDEFSRNGTTESSIVELDNGTLIMAARNYTGKTLFYKSTNNGETWEDSPVSIPEIPAFRVQPSIIKLKKDNQEYLVLQTANGPKKMNGSLYLIKVSETGNLEFVKSKIFEKSNFGYGALTKLSETEFLSTYEHAPVGYSQFSIAKKFLSLDWLLEDSGPDENTIIKTDVNGNKLIVEYKHPVTTIGIPTLELNGANTKFIQQSARNILEFELANPGNKIKGDILSWSNIDSINGEPLKISGSINLADFEKGTSIEQEEKGGVPFSTKPAITLIENEKPAGDIWVSNLLGDKVLTQEEKPELKVETRKGVSLTQDELPILNYKTNASTALVSEKPTAEIWGQIFWGVKPLTQSDKPEFDIRTLDPKAHSEMMTEEIKRTSVIEVTWEGVFSDEDLFNKVKEDLKLDGYNFEVLERPSTSKIGEYIAKLKASKEGSVLNIEIPIVVLEGFKQTNNLNDTNHEIDERAVQEKDMVKIPTVEVKEIGVESSTKKNIDDELNVEAYSPTATKVDENQVEEVNPNRKGAKALPKTNTETNSGLGFGLAAISAAILAFFRRNKKSE